MYIYIYIYVISRMGFLRAPRCSNSRRRSRRRHHGRRHRRLVRGQGVTHIIFFSLLIIYLLLHVDRGAAPRHTPITILRTGNKNNNNKISSVRPDSPALHVVDDSLLYPPVFYIPLSLARGSMSRVAVPKARSAK